MFARLKPFLQSLGRTEKFFLAVIVLKLVVAFAAPASTPNALLTFVVYIAGIVVAIRLARKGIGRAIWRLRNRLIVTYTFIAVVPIVLILTLVGISLSFLTGQVAVYLVSSELERRTMLLAGPAHFLTEKSPNERAVTVRQLMPFLRRQFPDVRVFIDGAGGLRYPDGADLASPPPGTPDTHGVLVKGGRLHAWAHVRDRGTEVTILAPLTHDILSELVPNLGDVFFLSFSDRSRGPNQQDPVRMDQAGGTAQARVPPAANRLDIAVTGFFPVQFSNWDEPGRKGDSLLVVNTRPSAVLGTVFGRFEWAQNILFAFLFAGSLFLVAEIVSVIIGVSLTRTITGAVHSLYEGTRRVMQGDFSHRIAVKGNDQIAELSRSFNHMTQNLERLIVVEKEKERMQSELEIAREVQNQLFPKNVPPVRDVELTGICNPARMVSGDYYDFVAIGDEAIALAIGDVAGKGISAALLMAAIQSIMRTQLTAGVPTAVAAGNGRSQTSYSTAYLVSQLNKQLHANTSPEKYATFCFGIYDEPSNTLTYTNAGHLPPILVRSSSVESLAVTGTVVGAFPFARYDEQKVRLGPGDLLVAYTDGIVEPENEYGEMFGEERLKEMLVTHRREETRGIIARVMEAVMQWTGSSELQDDMTLLVLRRV